MEEDLWHLDPGLRDRAHRDRRPERSALAASFGAALAAYRAGRFGEAAAMFAAIADIDPAARVLGQRARDLQAAPSQLA